MNSSIMVNKDSLDELDRIEENSIGSIVTDPPYLINFMNKSWDTKDNIAGSPDFWGKCFKALKPGGYAAVFGHSRTHHHIMNALEGAGFELRDTLTWLYGSGFPKSHNIGKAVDKVLGNERKVVGNRGVGYNDSEVYGNGKDEFDITKGNSEWEGYGTALKPAVEFIVLAQKPRDGTFANNVLTHGVGGLNIDGCRISSTDKAKFPEGDYTTSTTVGKIRNENRTADTNTEGRFPANLILSHSRGCVKVGEQDEKLSSQSASSSGIYKGGWGQNGSVSVVNATNDVYDCDDDCAVRMLNEQSGTKKGTGKQSKGSRTGGIWNASTGKPAGDTYGDSGGASRFFYCPKVSKKERELGCDELEERTRTRVNAGGLENDPKFAPVQNRNDHPTLKPVALMRWLVRLVTPPNETVLDPFMGAGSTGGACMLEGRDFYGIERDEKYFKIACARVEAWKKEVQ